MDQPLRGLVGDRATIVLFGDSLTQRGWDDGGWAAAVAHAYQRRADVYNRGLGGYNTRYTCWSMITLVFRFGNIYDMISSLKQGGGCTCCHTFCLWTGPDITWSRFGLVLTMRLLKPRARMCHWKSLGKGQGQENEHHNIRTGYDK